MTTKTYWGSVRYLNALNNIPVIKRSFGVFDSKGREIGGAAALIDGEYRIIECDPFVYGCTADRSTLEAEGPRWGYCPGATRDGKDFGASQSTSWFKTEAERDAAVEKYFIGAQKRAIKKSAA